MTVTSLARLTAAAATAITLLAGCGSSATTPAPVGGPGSGRPVSIRSFAFDPAGITIPAGSAVTWTNRDPTIHTVTSDPGASVTFDSGNLDRDGAFSHTFEKPGVYSYHCAIHAAMKATVTVQ
ncbi:MAG: plastocyanin/azurin family copper-binding protein [Candidatus Dormibacteria bacterium]